MFRFPDLKEAIQDFLSCQLAISPWLVSPETTERFDADLFHLINNTAKEFERLYWSYGSAKFIVGNFPLPERIVRTAIYETIASTAIQNALLLRGEFFVDETLILQAIHTTETFIVTRGIETLVGIFALVTSYENHLALRYYGQIPERVFNNGEWHRPWIDYSLSDELMLGAVIGSIRIQINNGIRMVELTECGIELLQINTEVLKLSGYVDHRKNMLQIAFLNHLEDYEELELSLIPQATHIRRDFLEWITISNGIQVLEVGCGTGTFLFSTGLAQKIGARGHVTGIDPATGMLAHAELTRRLYGIEWVDFQRADVEHIPFSEEYFDACVGVGFLQYSDLPRALSEMCRVTKPGGFIASLHPLEPEHLPDFYKTWFEPVLDLDLKLESFGIHAFPQSNEVEATLTQLGNTQIETKEISIYLDFRNPEMATEFFIYGLGVFQDLLAQVPWQARLDLIEELKQNGRSVLEQYGSEALIFPIKLQMVKAVKK